MLNQVKVNKRLNPIVEKREIILQTAIEVKSLGKVFDVRQKEAGFIGSLKSIVKPNIKKVVAVDNISFTIRKGDIVAFTGPNGAGKSTTIKILSGILHPTSGEVKIAGLIPWIERKKLAYKIGSVFGQKPQLWYHLPAIDTFNLFSKIYDLDPKEYKDRLNYLVKMFDINDIINTPVRELSLGQRMRCELVAALLNKPEIILLDEPTIGLDIIAKQKIRELIKELNKKEKVTILLTSHDTQDIEHLCERIIIINHGKIVYNGDMNELTGSYLTNKIVSVKFEDGFKPFKMQGLKIIRSEQYSADFELDTKKLQIKKLIDYLIKKFEVLDINISNTPIEEIITNIYNKK